MFNRGGTKQVVLYMGWYRREQWTRWKATAADGEKFEDSFDEWESTAKKQLHDLRCNNYVVRIVELELDAVREWCEARQRKLNGAARAEYATELGMEMDKHQRNPRPNPPQRGGGGSE